MCDDLCSSGTFYHSLYITFFHKTFFLYYHIRFNTWITRQNFGSNDWVDYMLLKITLVYRDNLSQMAYYDTGCEGQVIRSYCSVTLA